MAKKPTTDEEIARANEKSRKRKQARDRMLAGMDNQQTFFDRLLGKHLVAGLFALFRFLIGAGDFFVGGGFFGHQAAPFNSLRR